MNGIFTISLILNGLIVALLLVLIVYGRKIIKYIVFNKIIQVRHQQKLSMFSASPKVDQAIIFLGDSITEGGDWIEIFPNKNILNRGIGGDTTEGVLSRLDEIIRHQAHKIFICIGTNDLAVGKSTNNIIQNYQSILERLQKECRTTQIYVQAVLPVGKNVLFGHKNEKIQPLNVALEDLCKGLQIPFINIHPHFADEMGYLNPAFTNDKLHLMGKAYLHWKEILEPYINE
jgi:lysophospholipase L1-like esterase